MTIVTDVYDRAASWTPLEFRPLGHPCRPRFTRYKVARPRRFAVILNRYPFSVIGVGVVLGDHCCSLRWATPARYEPTGWQCTTCRVRFLDDLGKGHTCPPF